jgi:hypothetical protein
MNEQNFYGPVRYVTGRDFRMGDGLLEMETDPDRLQAAAYVCRQRIQDLRREREWPDFWLLAAMLAFFFLAGLGPLAGLGSLGVWGIGAVLAVMSWRRVVYERTAADLAYYQSRLDLISERLRDLELLSSESQ